MNKLFLTILTLTSFGLQGCGTPQKPGIPNLSQITEASVEPGGPRPSSDVTRFNPTTAEGKATPKRVVTWLDESKMVKMENPHRPMPTIGPPTLAITLKNGKQVLVEPATDTVTKDNGTIQIGHYAKGFIDLRYADSTKTFRLQSPPLDNWLLSYPWKSN